MQIELDLVWMSLLIFTPTIFAVILLFFPKGSQEYMRWFALLGTAVTFVFSALLFIDYLAMQDRYLVGLEGRPSSAASLASRVKRATLSEKLENEKRDDE